MGAGISGVLSRSFRAGDPCSCWGVIGRTPRSAYLTGIPQISNITYHDIL